MDRQPTEFYHGTSLASAFAIQAHGFRVDLAGSNASAALGSGVYVTTTLEKAHNYAKGRPQKPNSARGVVLKLKVDLERCKKIETKIIAVCSFEIRSALDDTSRSQMQLLIIGLPCRVQGECATRCL